MVRRDNLKSSIAELAVQIEDARAAQEEAQAELQKYEIARGSRKSRATAMWRPPRASERRTGSALEFTAAGAESSGGGRFSGRPKSRKRGAKFRAILRCGHGRCL